LVGRPFSESLLLRLGHRYQMETERYREIPRELRSTSTQASAAAE
jgi:hypothetical protein